VVPRELKELGDVSTLKFASTVVGGVGTFFKKLGALSMQESAAEAPPAAVDHKHVIVVRRRVGSARARRALNFDTPQFVVGGITAAEIRDVQREAEGAPIQARVARCGRAADARGSSDMARRFC
jgi:hypothetical protein